ncbi:MAG: hypothetical protein CH104c_0503 [Candidatus Woesebacteria bacterium]|nr:MAG: hypothetical protein CH104c_0503 [Candidatus Woesebacteria bacterium]
MPEDPKNKTDEQTELEKLLNSDETDEEEEGAGEEENKGQEGQESEEEENKGGEGEGQEETEGGEDEEDEFKGKSREEVIKMLKEQRQKVAELEKSKGEGEEEDKGKKGEEGKEEEEPTVPSAEELQKMTPSDFAKWVLARIDEGVKRTIESQDKVRSAVKKEIADAKKEHNLGDPDYRKMVLAIIEAASAKGTVIPLKEACQQVDAFLGKHKGKGEGEEESEELSDEEKSRLKKAKAQVESGAGAPTKPEGSDAEMKRIQKALEGSGQSPLGGLGI